MKDNTGFVKEKTLTSQSPQTTGRKNDPIGLKQRIFDSALNEFAESGLMGARMENIATNAETTKRMVVYHFKTKEALYLQVLEHVYRCLRKHELELDLSAYPPAEAIVKLVEASFDFHVAHPEFIRIVSTENMLRGRFIRQSTNIRQLNQTALTLLDDILERGKKSHLFKEDAQARDVHRLISSLCVHQVANQYTFGALFENPEELDTQTAHYRQLAVMVALRYLMI
ncbi:TetR family transcriptional regulator [Rouxiella sp. T17]|uniref:TetR family transcriptional regulator n=1 Tax=Rouxiella sp. T17 TaxID=3085684 RepID=UPI002FC938E2